MADDSVASLGPGQPGQTSTTKCLRRSSGGHGRGGSALVCGGQRPDRNKILSSSQKRAPQHPRLRLTRPGEASEVCVGGGGGGVGRSVLGDAVMGAVRREKRDRRASTGGGYIPSTSPHRFGGGGAPNSAAVVSNPRGNPRRSVGRNGGDCGDIIAGGGAIGAEAVAVARGYDSDGAAASPSGRKFDRRGFFAALAQHRSGEKAKAQAAAQIRAVREKMTGQKEDAALEAEAEAEERVIGEEDDSASNIDRDYEYGGVSLTSHAPTKRRQQLLSVPHQERGQRRQSVGSDLDSDNESDAQTQASAGSARSHKSHSTQQSWRWRNRRASGGDGGARGRFAERRKKIMLAHARNATAVTSTRSLGPQPQQAQLFCRGSEESTGSRRHESGPKESRGGSDDDARPFAVPLPSESCRTTDREVFDVVDADNYDDIEDVYGASDEEGGGRGWNTRRRCSEKSILSTGSSLVEFVLEEKDEEDFDDGDEYEKAEEERRSDDDIELLRTALKGVVAVEYDVSEEAAKAADVTAEEDWQRRSSSSNSGGGASEYDDEHVNWARRDNRCRRPDVDEDDDGNGVPPPWRQQQQGGARPHQDWEGGLGVGAEAEQDTLRAKDAALAAARGEIRSLRERLEEQAAELDRLRSNERRWAEMERKVQCCVGSGGVEAELQRRIEDLERDNQRLRRGGGA